MARPRTFTPEEAARRDKASKARSAKRRKHHFNDKRRERRFRLRDLDARHQPPDAAASTDSCISGRELHRPNLLWIDPYGNVRSEKWESAEELIRNWQKKQAKKRRKK